MKVKNQTSVEDNTTRSADQLNRSNKSGTGPSVPCRSTFEEKSESWRTIWHVVSTACDPTCVSRQGGRASSRSMEPPVPELRPEVPRTPMLQSSFGPPVSRATTTKWHLSPSLSEDFLGHVDLKIFSVPSSAAVHQVQPKLGECTKC